MSAIVDNGVLHLRYRRSSIITTAEWCRRLIDEILSYFNIQYTCSQSCINPSHSREKWTWKFRLSFLFLPSFSSFMHNSKTVQCILAICMPNECFTIRDFLLLKYNCMLTKIRELYMAPNTHHSRRVWTFYLSNDCCTIGDVFYLGGLKLHVRYDRQVMIGKLQVVRSAYRTVALLSKTFLVWFRVSWEIQLESYGPRHASVILWYFIACKYCKHVHVHTSLLGAQLRLTTKLR